MSFRISGLPAEPFTHLFSLSAEELAARGAVRVIADGQSGYPCRVSLTDAQLGQTVLLIHYEHHPVDSPYRSSYAIYVREGETKYDEVDRIPEQLRKRLLSIRAFDGRNMLLDADVVDGRELEATIARFLSQPRVSYLHVHYAKAGCYAARIDRA